ncbi:MAG: T9SS type A sorting domain-containing protein [Bacteroidetes bacterium]|nr:T9SS type A sorting domain-containing protein [Bacteroidota bacterium]
MNEHFYRCKHLVAASRNIIIDLTHYIQIQQWEIFDITGKLIYTGNIEMLHTQIPLHTNGNYLVVINQEGKNFVKKIMMI